MILLLSSQAGFDSFDLERDGKTVQRLSARILV